MNKPKNKRGAVKLALIVLAVVLLAACGTVWYLYSQVAPALDEGEAGQLNQVKDPDLEAEGDRTYNLLLLGIDYDTDRDYAETVLSLPSEGRLPEEPYEIALDEYTMGSLGLPYELGTAFPLQWTDAAGETHTDTFTL